MSKFLIFMWSIVVVTGILLLVSLASGSWLMVGVRTIHVAAALFSCLFTLGSLSKIPYKRYRRPATLRQIM